MADRFTISRDNMLKALANQRPGTLREAFPGEKPDVVADVTKECTAMTFFDKGAPGYSVVFPVPLLVEAGVGYVVEFHDGVEDA